MNEAEYVVPPSNGAPNHSGSAPKPPGQPNKAVAWVKSNKSVAIAGSAMAAVLILFGVMTVTGQKISLFGAQLNPLYQQASEPKCTDDIRNPCPPPGSEEENIGSSFSIQGTFANGAVNVPYTQTFSVNPQTYSSVGGPAGFCSWTVVSINPKLNFEASFKTQDGPGIISTFTATPKTAGTYLVNMKVSCSNTGQETTKSLAWNVDGVNSGQLSINANFADGIVGQDYTAILQAINSGADICTFALVSVTPPIAGAKVGPPDAVTNVFKPEADKAAPIAWFTAKPTNTGSFTVRVSVTCNPRAGDGPSKFAQKDFPFNVKSSQIEPPAPGNNELTLTANFTEGLVDKAYSTTISSEVGGTGSIYTCIMALDGVKPSVAGATLTPSNAALGKGTKFDFKATPKTAGTYTVSVTASCNPNNGSKIMSLVARKDFQWVVKTTGLTSDLGINGTFNDGNLNEPYTTDVYTTDGTTGCNFTLGSIVPALPGASLGRIDNVKESPGSGAMFSATPKTVGTYQIVIAATCPPLTGSTANRIVQKTFSWKVTTKGFEEKVSGPCVVGAGGPCNNNEKPVTSVNVCNDSAYKPKLIPVYRYWNRVVSDHFYTTNASEKANGYVFEGIAGYVFKEKVSGSTAVYRSYHQTLTSHYYSTADDAEKYNYRSEGIIGYAFAGATNGAVAWNRLHKGYPTSDYLETINSNEKASAIALGYKDEGVVAYICQNS